MKPKAFLSGPITRLGEKESFFLFARAEQSLQCHYEVLNPRVTGYSGEWSLKMKEAITMLMEADLVILLPGHDEGSPGSDMEKYIAKGLQMPIMELQSAIDGTTKAQEGQGVI